MVGHSKSQEGEIGSSAIIDQYQKAFFIVNMNRIYRIAKRQSIFLRVIP